MCYDEYLAAGYPIGSGAAEGACRHLVKDRMEGSGMRWSVPGAEAVLKIRALCLNGDWVGSGNPTCSGTPRRALAIAAGDP